MHTILFMLNNRACFHFCLTTNWSSAYYYIKCPGKKGKRACQPGNTLLFTSNGLSYFGFAGNANEERR